MTLGQFFRLCGRAGPRCVLGAHGRPSLKFETLARRLLRRPLTLPDGSTFGYSELVVSTIQSLYEPDVWDELAGLLQQLYGATQPRDTAVRLRELASQRSSSYDNTIEAYIASVCSETQNPRAPRVYRRVAKEAEQQARYVGAYWTYITLPCSRWPAQDRDSFAGPWSVRTRNPLLLLNPRFDPATPHHNALDHEPGTAEQPLVDGQRLGSHRAGDSKRLQGRQRGALSHPRHLARSRRGLPDRDRAVHIR